jgi:hypothetical protein
MDSRSLTIGEGTESLQKFNVQNSQCECLKCHVQECCNLCMDMNTRLPLCYFPFSNESRGDVTKQGISDSIDVDTMNFYQVLMSLSS